MNIALWVLQVLYPNIGLNAVLGVLVAIVAWGRFGPYHF